MSDGHSQNPDAEENEYRLAARRDREWRIGYSFIDSVNEGKPMSMKARPKKIHGIDSDQVAGFMLFSTYQATEPSMFMAPITDKSDQKMGQS